MRLGVKMHGLNQLSRMYARVGTGGQRALTQAVFMEANDVLNESKKIVPVDTGNLKGSGRVEPPVVSGSGVSVEVTYGGAAAPYALYVHEDLNASHAPGKSAKYLEIPALQRKPLFTRNVKERFVTYIRRGA
jgi:hypothetical protein